jgi:hypothetical protein
MIASRTDSVKAILGQAREFTAVVLLFGKARFLTTLYLDSEFARGILDARAKAVVSMSTDQKTRWAKVSPLWVAAVALPGCLMPPASVVQSAQASGTTTDAPPAKNIGDVPAPSKPTGELISDGTQPTVMNLHPGGEWFIFNDHTVGGVMTPASNGEFASALKGGVIHTAGKGFTEWGGGIGFNFQGAEALTPIDASDFTGITFKAWGSTPMHVGLATTATMPEFNKCKPTKCYDHFATDINDLTSTPKVYTFTWAQLKPAGFGSPKPVFDPKAVVGLNFTAKGGIPWDFTIDDLKFTK